MEQRTQQARRFYRRRGESVFAGMRSVCVQHACGGPGGLPLGSATHFHSVAIATQHREPIANPPNSAQLWGIPYHSAEVTFGSVQ